MQFLHTNKINFTTAHNDWYWRICKLNLFNK